MCLRSSVTTEKINGPQVSCTQEAGVPMKGEQVAVLFWLITFLNLLEGTKS